MIRLFRLLARLPLGWLHVSGSVLGWLTYLLSPTYRRRLHANLQQAGYPLSLAWPAAGHAGRMVGELPRLWFGAPVPCEWRNADLLEAAYAAGNGVVFLTPHLGCFEITAQAMARQYTQRFGPLTVLYRPARQRWLAELLAVSRERPGLKTAPTTTAGVRQMMRALRSGEAVGLLPDQVPPAGMGVWAPFFGRDAYTMTLSARLAQQTGAAVLLAWGERLARGRGFVVHLSSLRRPLSDALDAAAQQLNEEMEQLIRQCPQQYLWGYARYKQPRGSA